MNHIARLNKLNHELDKSNLDAFLITHLPNIHYLCGFTGSAGVLASAQGRWAFFTDGRYTEQANNQVEGAQVLVDPAPALTRSVQWLVGELKRSQTACRIGVEAEHLTIAMQSRVHQEARRLIPTSKFRLVKTTETVEQLRIRKDSAEIAETRKAIHVASEIFARVLKSIRPENTENDVAAEIEYLARRAGAEKMSFETIVAAGPHSAMPHARPTRSKIGHGFVVLDYGVILAGYCSDMTRTVYVGNARKPAKGMYAAVLESQVAGIAAVRAGVQAQEVDAAARNVLKQHKLDHYFTHSLGHGVGLEIHESPRLAKGQKQTLEAGMIVTIEPGVYIPRRGGVRIEDMVLVTDKGCEVLTPTPKEFVIC